MNKIYRVIWSNVRHCYMVVSEIAKSHSKPVSKCSRRCASTTAVFAVFALLSVPASAYAQDASTSSSNAHYYSVNSTEQGSDSNYDNDGATGGTDALAAGVRAKSTGQDTIAVGTGAQADRNTGIAIGKGAVSTIVPDLGLSQIPPADLYAGIAIGTGALSTMPDNIVIGRNATAKNEEAIAIGKDSMARDDQSIAIGSGAKSLGRYGIAIGENATAGVESIIGTYGNIAIGRNASSDSGVSIGDDTTSGSFGIAVGLKSQAGERAAALGYANTATGLFSSALGVGNQATDQAATAVGNGNKATGRESVAIGFNNEAKSSSAIAVGSGNNVSGQWAGAIGRKNTVANTGTYVLGRNITTTQDNSVVLGSDSTDRAATQETSGSINHADGTATTYDHFAGTAPVGVVSVGDTGKERQIINVAAGKVSADSTDAVNGSQLYSLATEVDKNTEAISESKVHYYSVNSTEKGNDSNYDNKGATGGNALAAGVRAKAAGQDALAIGTGAEAKRNSSIAIGNGASSRMADTIAIGRNTITRDDGAIAIGKDSQATTETTIAVGSGSRGIGKNGIAIGTGATAGSDDSNIIFGNIAIGTGASAAGGISIGDNTTSDSFGTAVGLRSQAGDRASAIGYSNTATGLFASALGVGNKSTDQSATAVGNGNEAFGKDSVALGVNSKAHSQSAIAVGNRNFVSGQGAVAIGRNNTVANTDTYVLGRDVTTTQDNSVILGAASTDRAATQETTGMITHAKGEATSYGNFAGTAPVGVISVGASGKERQIINVAAGKVSADSTDAVNGSQLHSLAVEVGKNTDAISALEIKADKQHTTVKAGENDNLTVTEGINENGGKEYTIDLSDTLSFGGPGKDGKDGKNGHIGVNGKDGVSGVGIDGKDGISVQGDKGEVGINGNDGISVKGADGKDAVTINGKDGVGHIGLTGPAGTNGKDGTSTIDISVKNGHDGADGTKGAAGVDGKAGLTRIIYEDKLGEHQVATLDDGMKYGGDTGGTIAKKLNNQVNVVGGISDTTKLTAQDNIGVVSDGQDSLKVRLAKDLKGIDSISNGKDGDQNTTISLGNREINVNGTKITNVGDGDINEGSHDAVNGDQVFKLSKQITQEITQISKAATTVKAGENQNLTVTEGVNENGGKEYTIDLSDTLAFGGPGKDGKDGKDGHIGVNGKDGVSGVGIDGKDGISVKGDKGEVGINGNDGISVKGADGKDAVTINGKDGVGHIGLTGPAGTNGKDGTSTVDISVKNGYDGTDGTKGSAGVDGKDGLTRIVYEDKLGEHQVATLDDGMKYGGDAGHVIAQKLNNQVNIIGGIHDTSKLADQDNLGIVSDGHSNLTVRLAKNLQGIESISNGKSGDQNTTISLDNKEVNVHNARITNVGDGNVAPGSADVVTGNQLYQMSQGVSQVSQSINKLGNRINHVGAGAAALAALHPQDFDPDDKWDFAAGYGNYKNANALAIGAFYRPSEDVMLSVGGAFSSGDNMVNAGVTFKLGQSNGVSRSRVSMAKEILELRAAVDYLMKQNKQMTSPLAKNGATNVTGDFSDVPKDHWAYKYVKTLADEGYLKGYPDGSFKGDKAMSRYEYAAIIYRALQNGAPLDGKMAQSIEEFKPEMESVQKAARFHVDRVSGKDDDRNKIERVRVNSKDDAVNTDYRDVYGSHIKK